MTMQDYATYSVIPDYLVKSYAANMLRYAPNGMAPIFGLTSLAGSGKALQVEHGYFSKTMIFPSVQLDGLIIAGDTTITVDSTTNILPGDLLRVNTTGEIIRVATVASATSLTVARAVGQVAAAGAADNVVLYCVGNAFEQGSTRPQSRLMNPTRITNNTQIFRNSWALPGTMAAIATLVGDSLTGESRQDCGLLHAAAIEAALIFGQKSGQVINGQYLTTMDGIVETIRRHAVGNTTTAGGTTTYAQLETALEPVFDTISNGRNGNERTLFVGGTARKVINGIGRLSGQYQIVDGQTSFGMNFQTFRTSRGMFRMIEHPLLNSNADWAKMAIALDLPSLRLMYLEGRKTQNREYGMNGTPVDSGIDAVGGTLTTEVTLEMVNPTSHAVIFGLTAAA